MSFLSGINLDAMAKRISIVLGEPLARRPDAMSMILSSILHNISYSSRQYMEANRSVF